MPARRIGRTPAARRPRTTGTGSVHGRCRWCGADVMWLAHVDTGKLAPIDRLPQPGGNVLVLRTTDAKVTGAYSVIVPDERGLFDTTVAVDDEATPSLHFNHWATCTNATARRLAKERARSGRRVPTTIDGEPIGRDTSLDAPAEALAAHHRCPGCAEPVDPVVLAEGNPFHPCCDPDPNL